MVTKLKFNLTWDLIWEHPFRNFILASVANVLTTNVIHQDEETDVRDLMWQLFLFYYGRNKDLTKDDLVFVVPARISSYLLKLLYGKTPTYEEQDPKLNSFLGIEVKTLTSLANTILLVNKKWSNTILKCEFAGNLLDISIDPAFESRWSKATLLRGKR